MLVMTHQENLELFEKAQKQVAVIYIGDQTKKAVENVNLLYPSMPGLLPSKDTINAVISGHMSHKELMKDVIKWVKHPVKSEETALNVAVTTVMTMAKRAKKEGVVVFAYDDSEQSKMLCKYIKALFGGIFGVKILAKEKELKNLFKKGSAKKIAERVRDYSGKKKNQTSPDDDGELTIIKNAEFFRPEMLLTALTQGMSVGADSIANALLNMFTNDNMKNLDESGIANIEVPAKVSKKERKDMSKKERKKYDNSVKGADAYLKDVKKLYKGLKAKNEMAYDEYKTFIAVWETIDPVVLKNVGLNKSPKVKKGTEKKGKKGNKVVVAKMSKKQRKAFREFYTEKNGVFMCRLAFAHVANELMGLAIGDDGYCASIKAVMTKCPRLKGKRAMDEIGIKDLTNAYIKAAKAYAKGNK